MPKVIRICLLCGLKALVESKLWEHKPFICDSCKPKPKDNKTKKE